MDPYCSAVEKRDEPGFILLVAGHIVSTLGSSIYLVALVLYLAEATDSPRVLGFVPSKEPWHGPEINLWVLGTREDDPEATPLYAIVEWESESVDEAVAREAAKAAMPIWGSAFPGTISCSRPRRRTG